VNISLDDRKIELVIVFYHQSSIVNEKREKERNDIEGYQNDERIVTPFHGFEFFPPFPVDA